MYLVASKFFDKPYKLVVFVSLFCLSLSCTDLSNAQNENSKWVKPESTTISCEEYYSELISLGVLTNNVWNKGAAGAEMWSQCLEKRIHDGVVQYGWSWSWPFGREVIYAQPQIKIGASPWAPEPKFNTAFPIKIADLNSLKIEHELDVTTNGNHNNVVTMWLVSEPYKGSKPRPEIIVAEIMIWTYATENHFDPAGKEYSELKINDGIWEVWYDPNWYDTSGVNKNRWINLSFRAKHQSMKANIPALALMKYAISEGLISADDYIADIELGNEIMNGSGITWIKSFSVDFD